ncbi:MAG: hypothetical protein ACRDAU_00980 [Clostridium sp.]
MIKKVMMFLFLILMMVTVGSTTTKSYYELEGEVKDITEYDSNGVRLQYTSLEDIEAEKERLKDIYIKSYKIIEQDKFNLKLIGKISINVNLSKQRGKTYVSLTTENENEKYSSLKIRKELQKATSKNTENIKIFSYYKGRVLESEKGLILENIKNNNVANLKIENGYTWKNKVGNETVNFGLINYDTGLYLIIGTPVIFTTY